MSFIDVGVKLHVTPTIHDDGFVTMKIKPEISSEEPTLYPVPNSGSIPIVDTSEVQTTVRVKDGVTIIIGGLMKDELTNSKTQVPILGDLPIIGKAFRTEDRNVQKTEIVIFLPPISSMETCILIRKIMLNHLQPLKRHIHIAIIYPEMILHHPCLNYFK